MARICSTGQMYRETCRDSEALRSQVLPGETDLLGQKMEVVAIGGADLKGQKMEVVAICETD